MCWDVFLPTTGKHVKYLSQMYDKCNADKSKVFKHSWSTKCFVFNVIPSSTDWTSHLIFPYKVDDLTVSVPPGGIELHNYFIVCTETQSLDGVQLVQRERRIEQSWMVLLQVSWENTTHRNKLRYDHHWTALIHVAEESNKTAVNKRFVKYNVNFVFKSNLSVNLIKQKFKKTCGCRIIAY